MYIKNLVEMDLFPEAFPVRVIQNKDREFEYPDHWHKAIEIVVADRNDSEIDINNHRYTLKEGDLVFIAGGDIHSYPLSKGAERKIILFEIPNMEDNIYWKEEYRLLNQSVLIKKGACEATYHQIIDQIGGILQEGTNIQPGSGFVLLARIYDLVALIIRNMHSSEKLKGSIRKDLLLKMGKVVEYIQENYMKMITLKSAAEAAGFSEHYLSRIFSQALDVPFHQYLNKVRVKHAENKIVMDEGTIAQIAFQCGFNSIPTFNRVFREIKGCTPLQYRKLRWDHIDEKNEEIWDGEK